MGYYKTLPFLDISFKQTTSKSIKCRKCRSCVDGKDGYIKININFRDWKKMDMRVVACMDCWDKFFKEIEKAKINKTKSYEELVKRGILKSLK